MKKNPFLIIIIVLVLLFCSCESVGVSTVESVEENQSGNSQTSAQDRDDEKLTPEQKSEVDKLLLELNQLIEEQDKEAVYSSMHLTLRDADQMNAANDQIRKLGLQLFELIEPISDLETKKLADEHNGAVGNITAYVRAKLLSDEVAAMVNRYRELTAAEPVEDETNAELCQIAERLYSYGIYPLDRHESNPQGKKSASKEQLSSVTDDEGFLSLMNQEGFTVVRSGTGILASGMDGEGREWRVVGDSPDAALTRIALVTRSDGGEWTVSKMNETRMSYTGALVLKLTDGDFYDGLYGATDKEEKTVYTGRRHAVHLFYQGNDAQKEISWELLSALMPNHVSVELWQKDCSYVIHLAYYGTYAPFDGLSNLQPETIYYTLKGMGVLQSKE